MTGEVPQWVSNPDRLTGWEMDPDTLKGLRDLAARDQLSSSPLEQDFADFTEPVLENDVIEVSQYLESNN